MKRYLPSVALDEEELSRFVGEAKAAKPTAWKVVERLKAACRAEGLEAVEDRAAVVQTLLTSCPQQQGQTFIAPQAV